MTLKSLGLAMEVLSMFTKDTPVWGLRDLSKEMNINHTIIYRILKTFEDKKIVIQDSSSKKYQLGSGLLPLFVTYKSRNTISDLIVPVMNELSEKTGESVFLTWKEGHEGVTVEIVESSNNIRFTVSKGTRAPLYIGASTKSIMAFLTEQEKDEIINKGIKKRTERSLDTKEDIYRDLDMIKEKEWAYTEGEYSDEVFGISTPIFNAHGDVIASLTLAGPTYRINEEKKETILKELINYTDKVTDMLNIYDANEYI